MTEKAERLKRRMWITRKCRIEAAERIKAKHEFYQFIIVYYSIFLVFLSVLNLSYQDKGDLLSILILSSSIGLSLFSMFITSKSLLDRYYNLKNNYIYIDELSDELEDLMNNPKDEFKINEGFNTIKKRYNTLLSTVENHKPIDYINFLLSPANDEERTPTQSEIKKVFFNRIKLHIINILLIIAPILLLLTIFFF